MSNLQHRQTKIQEKRKQTSRRDFVMEICSWQPFTLYRFDKGVSRYPYNSERNGILCLLENHIAEYPEGVLVDTINNSSTNFLTQFGKLWLNIPKTSSHYYGGINENVTWVDTVFSAKNCYLSFVIGDTAENILYSSYTYTNVKNVYSSVYVTTGCNNIYSCKTVRESYNIFYSKHIYNSSNIRFSSNLLSCQECIFCDNLENQSYYIENIQYSPEEYYKKKREICSNKSTFSKYQDNVKKIGLIRASENCTGGAIFMCSNVSNGHEITTISNSRNIMLSDGGDLSSNCYDCFDIGLESHHLYGVAGQGKGEHIYCSTLSNHSSNIYYCYSMNNCSFCLGCIGLKNKSYCILNKQYTKEEWYQKVDEIFAQMEQDGTLGQFFPASMNPFYFNDTAAYLIDPSFTKEEVTAAGYLWRDEPIKVDIPEGAEIIKVEDLEQYEGFDEQGNWIINKDILKKIIQDEQGNVYRIVAMEYDFLMKYGLPLPRKHWLDRMRENFKIS